MPKISPNLVTLLILDFTDLSTFREHQSLISLKDISYTKSRTFLSVAKGRVDLPRTYQITLNCVHFGKCILCTFCKVHLQ